MTDYNKIIDKFGDMELGHIIRVCFDKGKEELGLEIVKAWRFQGSVTVSEILRDEMQDRCIKEHYAGQDYPHEKKYTNCEFKSSPKATELFQLLKTL